MAGTDTDKPWGSVLSGADASSVQGPAPDLPADQPCRQRDDGLDDGLKISRIQIYQQRQRLTEVRWRKGGPPLYGPTPSRSVQTIIIYSYK